MGGTCLLQHRCSSCCCAYYTHTISHGNTGDVDDWKKKLKPPKNDFLEVAQVLLDEVLFQKGKEVCKVVTQ